MSRSLQTIPLSTAYAAFTAITSIGTVGITAFHEPVTMARLACIALVVAGVVGLRLTTPA